METFEVFEVSIEKRVFVVPFDLQSNSVSSLVLAIENAYVIDFVRDGFARLVIDCFFDGKCFFDPFLRSQAISKALSALRFTAARPNDFFDRLIEQA